MISLLLYGSAVANFVVAGNKCNIWVNCGDMAYESAAVVLRFSVHVAFE